jgi:hypothetical protein
MQGFELQGGRELERMVRDIKTKPPKRRFEGLKSF